MENKERIESIEELKDEVLEEISGGEIAPAGAGGLGAPEFVEII